MQVYLDNSATTRPSDAVAAAMLECMQRYWHNPSALYKPALEVEKLVEAARQTCLKAVGAPGQKMIFTSGGTEADNIAILGHLRTVRKPGRVLISAVEHPAVSACTQEIERMGHKVQEMPVTATGEIDLEALRRMLADDVRMICVMQVNNETGAIMPLEQIVSLRNELCRDAAIHVDGVQGFLRVPIQFNKLGIQSYAFSGHKIHASKGIGGLIFRKEHKLNPVVFGGGQEDNYRSGTENVPGMVGLGEAVKSFPQEKVADMESRKRQLYEGLMKAVPGAVLNGPALDDPASAPHILNMSLPPVRSQTMLFALEGDGVYVSAGSACASHKQKVSGILTAMGVPRQLADCALRFSLCPDVTAEEIDYTIAMVKKHYDMLKMYVRR